MAPRPSIQSSPPPQRGNYSEGCDSKHTSIHSQCKGALSCTSVHFCIWHDVINVEYDFPYDHEIYM